MTVKDVLDTDEWLLEPDTAANTSTELLYPPLPPSRAGHEDPYADEQADRQSRRTALIGLTFAAIFGLLCLVFGAIVAARKSYDDEVVGIATIVNNHNHPEIVTELVRFAFTQLNTFATEAIGYVHSVTQRSTLAAKATSANTSGPAERHHNLSRRSPLQFHTNLRFCTAPRNARIPSFHPNGTVCNIFMGLLLILSYASVSLSILGVSLTRESEGRLDIVAAIGVPLIVLGLCILLKCCIVTIGFYQTEILAWSSSPLDNTHAAIAAGKISRIEGLCMYSVVDSMRADAMTSSIKPSPRRPSTTQPSAWHARSGVRRTIVALWSLVVACGTWGTIIVAVWAATSLKETTPGPESWNFFPNAHSNAVTIPLVFSPALNWFVCFFVLILVQGSLTMALHCCELVVNVLRDEDMWRRATTKTGTESADVLKSFVSFWPSIVLLVGKTVLHWIFGFCLSLQGSLLGNGCTLGSHKGNSRCTSTLALPIIMRSVQVWYLTIALVFFSACMTFLATRKPKGPQPAAYGHIQTLANLIDEWNPSMKMWWGHKEGEVLGKDGEFIYHAGTDDSPLPPVKPDVLYS